MEPEPAAHLERSVSRLSTTSATSARSSRGQTVRAKSKNRIKLPSQPSSSASSIAASDKSLTSFPSFSPEAPGFSTSDVAITALPISLPEGRTSNLRGTDSRVGRLTSSETSREARDALFEDAPVSTRRIPGALHLVDDEHIEHLIARHGAVTLIRQIAEDLAHRDAQISNLRRRADGRERALKKIILQCGLSNLDLETRLREIDAETKSQEQAKRGEDGRLTDMMNDAMQDSVAGGGSMIESNDTTAGPMDGPLPKENDGKGTVKGWKDWLLGSGTGTSKRNSRASSVNNDATRATVIKGVPPTDRRPTIREDLFTPPEPDSVRSSSRASSINSTYGPRKPSTSLASMALQLVAGKATGRDGDSTRGRSNSAGQGDLMRAQSRASTKTTASARVVSSQVGPKALMAMRRATPGPITIAQRTQAAERWDSMGASPTSPMVTRPDNYGPVEMDTIFSPEGQPPTLSQGYSNNHDAEYLTDRFGFIYDQRRKKRQREATATARQFKRGGHTEMLTNKRLGISPNSFEDGDSYLRAIDTDDMPDTPASGDSTDQGKPKRWQDYLKAPTFPTELLSHTPSITASGLVVHEGNGAIASEERGFVPVASTTAAVVDKGAAAEPAEAAPAVTLVKEDVEPVRLLLQQLSDVHDKLQREKMVRWNEFLRKVRAERKREGEAAAAAAAAAAGARYERAPLMIPEAKIADGEIIGIADLGVKGKVGRAKWNEFRNLVLGGIPVANRPKVWSECSGATFMRIPGYYEDLASRAPDDDDAQAVSQIQMDITRTLTDNIFFRKGPGVAKLKEVLLAYSRRNPDVGYCQGMNLIAANLLLIMPSAEDTFWILASIVERILPEGYYDHSLLTSRADQHVLRQYVTHVLPRLSQHLEELCIELEALTFQWFLSVFTDCLSAEALFRVWDVVLCTHDGSTFLFQVALALLKLNEQQLLQCSTPAAIYTYINHQMTNHAISIDGLLQASEALRRVVRREDVEERRTKAVEADKQLMKEREENSRLRRLQKTASAPAVITPQSASAIPSPVPSPGPRIAVDRESFDVARLEAVDGGDEGVRSAMVRTPTPAEEEMQLSLG
jgi:small G protein signaling modulator 3